ncbi:uncharacterized protein MONBRDRAFT_34485, partial [Monosiga brevicollis MX1]
MPLFRQQLRPCAHAAHGKGAHTFYLISDLYGQPGSRVACPAPKPVFIHEWTPPSIMAVIRSACILIPLEEQSLLVPLAEQLEARSYGEALKLQMRQGKGGPQRVHIKTLCQPGLVTAIGPLDEQLLDQCLFSLEHLASAPVIVIVLSHVGFAALQSAHLEPSPLAAELALAVQLFRDKVVALDSSEIPPLPSDFVYSEDCTPLEGVQLGVLETMSEFQQVLFDRKCGVLTDRPSSSTADDAPKQDDRAEAIATEVERVVRKMHAQLRDVGVKAHQQILKRLRRVKRGIRPRTFINYLPSLDPSFKCKSRARLHHDFFLSYRQQAHGDFAPEVAACIDNMRRDDGVLKGDFHCFLDQRCLETGQPWRSGFLNVIRACNIIAILVSPLTLDRMRTADEFTDNVLLEWETALDMLGNKLCKLMVFCLDDPGRPFIMPAFDAFPDQPTPLPDDLVMKGDRHSVVPRRTIRQVVRGVLSVAQRHVVRPDPASDMPQVEAAALAAPADTQPTTLDRKRTELRRYTQTDKAAHDIASLMYEQFQTHYATTAHLKAMTSAFEQVWDGAREAARQSLEAMSTKFSSLSVCPSFEREKEREREKNVA